MKSAASALRERYIDQAHYGNGTGCRCCDLVDDGLLEALLDERDRLRDLVVRFRQWDDLPGRADGPFWMSEADRVLGDA